MLKVASCFIAISFLSVSFTISCQSQNTLTISGVPPNAVTDTTYAVSVTATNTAYVGPVKVTTNDAAALLSATSVSFLGGKASFQIEFKTSGAHTVTITDAAVGGPIPAIANTTVSGSSAAAIAACASCYATIGAGAVLSTTKFGDYNNSSNILQTTHLGSSTPQFVAGIAYKLPIRPFIPKLYNYLGCSKDSFFSPLNEGQAAYCYPLKVFVSLKFSPDASQTFNGFTYGISHALHKRLDVMLGVSYSAHNEISPGFIQAAVNTVKTQTALGNKNYMQWILMPCKKMDQQHSMVFPCNCRIRMAQ
jgi:hypothetical protein